MPILEQEFKIMKTSNERSDRKLTGNEIQKGNSEKVSGNL